MSLTEIPHQQLQHMFSCPLFVRKSQIKRRMIHRRLQYVIAIFAKVKNVLWQYLVWYFLCFVFFLVLVLVFIQFRRIIFRLRLICRQMNMPIRGAITRTFELNILETNSKLANQIG